MPFPAADNDERVTEDLKMLIRKLMSRDIDGRPSLDEILNQIPRPRRDRSLSFE